MYEIYGELDIGLYFLGLRVSVNAIRMGESKVLAYWAVFCRVTS